MYYALTKLKIQRIHCIQTKKLKIKPIFSSRSLRITGIPRKGKLGHRKPDIVCWLKPPSPCGVVGMCCKRWMQPPHHGGCNSQLGGRLVNGFIMGGAPVIPWGKLRPTTKRVY